MNNTMNKQKLMDIKTVVVIHCVSSFPGIVSVFNIFPELGMVFHIMTGHVSLSINKHIPSI